MTHVIPVTVTIRSTTGTQAITFERISPEKVQITTEDGATQEYWVADLRKALETEAYGEQP